MLSRLRRVVLIAALAAPASGSLRAQDICDQLLPIGLVPPPGGFAIGCSSLYALLPGGASGQPGTWVALAYPPCANGPCAGVADPMQFVCTVTSGYECCVGVSQLIPLRPGVNSGPVGAGIDQRFANDTDTRTTICYSDYAGSGARVAYVPLIQTLGSGNTNARIIGFRRMFFVRPMAPLGVIVIEFVDGPTPVPGTTWGLTKIRYR